MAAREQSGIYTITHVKTDRVYVGQSANVCKRLMAHLSLLRKGNHRNPKLQSAFNYYGEDAFRFEPLEDCPVECLDGAEQFWINSLRSNFNLAPAAGVQRGYKFTDVARAKLRETFARPDVAAKRKIAAKQRWEKPGFRENISRKVKITLTGRKQSPDTIAKRTSWQEGTHRSAEFCASVTAGKLAANFKFTADSIEKMRISHIGKSQSPEAKAKCKATWAAKKEAKRGS